MPKTKKKPKAAKKNSCQIKDDLGCNNQIVRLVTGTQKDDPQFWCCIGCRAILGRRGLKLKEVPLSEIDDSLLVKDAKNQS